jgi:hypothetical protein
MSLELPNWAQKYNDAQAEIARLHAYQLNLLRALDRLISERDRARGDLARLRGLLRACVEEWNAEWRTNDGLRLKLAIEAARKEVTP